MQKISVYLNERASNTSFDYWKQKIGSSLFRSDLLYRTPSTLDELNNYLEDDLDSGVEAIVSVGGDGTVNTLIQKLAGHDVGLLVIPGGTANDLAGELGNKRNIKKVIQCIRNKEFKTIDLIDINGRFMATNGGIGLGGPVAVKIDRLRKQYPMFRMVMKLSGKNIYSFFVAQELLSLRFKSHRLRITSEQFSGEYNVPAILINNQKTLAGNFPVAPTTDNSDGTFNVVILTHPDRNKLIRCVVRVSLGQHPVDDPHFHTFETNRIKIENLDEGNIPFYGDGEIFTDSNVWDVSIKEQSLKVYSRNVDSGILEMSNNVTLN